MASLKTTESMCLYASNLLEEMGFKKVSTSPESVSLYYVHPFWKDAVIRVSNHGLCLRKRKSQARRLGVKVMQNLTFPEHIKPKSQLAVDTIIANGLGFMMMERLSSYRRPSRHAN